MSLVAQPKLHRVTRILALVLALASVVFLAQLIPHSHANGQDEAACRLCQVIHLGVALAVAAVSIATPLVWFGPVHAPALIGHSRIFSAHSSSRAPPTLSLASIS